MDFLRWELRSWRTQKQPRLRSIFTETKKVANFLQQSWKRGALFILVLALMPVLFPLALFSSFVGFIYSIPLLCGAAICYTLFCGFYRSFSITGLFSPFKYLLEGLSSDSQSTEARVPRKEHVIKQVESRQHEAVLKSSAIVVEDAQVKDRASSARTTLHLDCELLVNERDEADNLEFRNVFKMNIPSEVNGKISGFGAEPRPSANCHTHPDIRLRERLLYLSLPKFKNEDRTCFGRVQNDFTDEAHRGEAGEITIENFGMDIERASCSSLLAPGEEPKSFSVRANSHPVVSRFSEGRNGGNSKVLGCETFEGRDYDTGHARYWREEVEDSVSSFYSFAKVTHHMGNRNSEALRDVACLNSFKNESKKIMRMNDQDDMCLLGCATADAFSASQVPNLIRCKEILVAGENGRTGSTQPFAISPRTHQKRLVFSNDRKQRSVSTTFSSDYTWPSESSEQDSELLSTRGTAHEEVCVDTASSTAQYETKFVPESGGVLDPSSSTCPSFSPTSDQLAEDWETRRKRWEEESTPGSLVPFVPFVEARPVEARSMCNPLFEFSTPSPPLRKLNVRGKSYLSDSSSFQTPSQHQQRLRKCKSSKYTERRDSEVIDSASTSRRHNRSYSASFMENMEPYSGEFEGLLGLWRKRDKTTHSVASSPRDSPTATSPAEVAHKIRQDLNTIQMVIGQKIPPQYSLWKEVETLSQMINMKLPYMGDISDLSKARQGLDLLKVVIGVRWDVEL